MPKPKRLYLASEQKEILDDCAHTKWWYEVASCDIHWVTQLAHDYDLIVIETVPNYTPGGSPATRYYARLSRKGRRYMRLYLPLHLPQPAPKGLGIIAGAVEWVARLLRV